MNTYSFNQHQNWGLPALDVDLWFKHLHIWSYYAIIVLRPVSYTHWWHIMAISVYKENALFELHIFLDQGDVASRVLLGAPIGPSVLVIAVSNDVWKGKIVL